VRLRGDALRLRDGLLAGAPAGEIAAERGAHLILVTLFLHPIFVPHARRVSSSYFAAGDARLRRRVSAALPPKSGARLANWFQKPVSVNRVGDSRERIAAPAPPLAPLDSRGPVGGRYTPHGRLPATLRSRGAWYPRPVRRIFAVIVVATAALGVATASGSSASQPLERVTVISDSVAASIAYNTVARTVLASGIDLDLQLAPCRRLVGESCPHGDVRPPALVVLVPTIKLGTTVIVIVGYNDYEDTFAASVEAALQALDKGGAKRILWLTMRAERQSYLHMNDLIREAAAHHPEVSIVEWNLYSRSHPEWFQPDGIHLVPIGTQALATFLHLTLDKLGLVAPQPPSALTIVTKSLPPGRIGHPYSTRLAAAGGGPPIRWVRSAGAIPTGLHLRSDGSLTGNPRVAGRRLITLLASDATGLSATRRFTIAVLPR